MDCTRCQGLMTEDHFMDMEGTMGFMYMKGWRCLNCGHVADALIEANRRLQEATMLELTQETQKYKGEVVYLRGDAVRRLAA